MSEVVAYKAIEESLAELTPGGKLNIVFFGGEPLLNWPLAKKTIHYCEDDLKSKYSDRKFTYHITSNLSILPSDLIDWALKYKISFLCDIDGEAYLHNMTRPFINGSGSHEIIVKNIKRLKENNIPLELRTTVTSYNVDYMLEISQHHKALGGCGSAFVAVNPVTSDSEILPLEYLPDPDKYVHGLLEVYESGLWEIEQIHPLNVYISRAKGQEVMEQACGAPYGNTPVVDIAGNIFACIYLVGVNNYNLGNLFDGSYPREDIINQMLENLNIDNNEPCKNCSWRYLCGGGCPVGKLSIARNPKASKEVISYTQDIACKTSKTMIETLLWRFAIEATSYNNTQ